jgi:hypothetical protein
MPELLGMTEHMADLRRLNALSLVVLLLGAAGLAELCGALGTALAVSASITVNGFGAVLLAHRRLGLCPWALLADIVWRRRRSGK